MKKRKTQKLVTITNGPWKIDVDGAVLHNGAFITTLRNIPYKYWRSVLTVASIAFTYGSKETSNHDVRRVTITVED